MGTGMGHPDLNLERLQWVDLLSSLQMEAVAQALQRASTPRPFAM